MPTLNQALEIIKKNKISNNKIAFIEKLDDIKEEIKWMIGLWKKMKSRIFCWCNTMKKLIDIFTKELIPRIICYKWNN